ncbi:FMRFamide receptor-like [Paramacrobiotus metropolitanus]|uniref:FMRFamide receptor-like n=1 Tax=Paramacrobiotus metropolitanus TaxID=2943436 RepID=UPI002445DDF1|nr:FMRFamide receptor-like [Paramacrobiotus metropolitanus]
MALDYAYNCRNATYSTDNCSTPDTSEVYYQDFLDLSRFWIQRIFIPIISIVGIIVNCMTIIVFSQRRLRSSTNMYLKALAAFDLLYLMSVLTLSFYHYPNHHPYFTYYKPYGYFITDFASNVSVWLTAAFTVERFTVIRNPMKSMKHATSQFAKRVVFTITVCCFVATFPTLMEYHVQDRYNLLTNTTVLELHPTALGKNATYKNVFYWFTSVTFVFLPFLLIAALNMFLLRSLRAARSIRSSLSSAVLASELRTTFLLVTVILMFLFCQTPAAVMLIVSLFNERHGFMPDNLQRGLNNIINLLVAVNACANFFLYVGLSIKFRKTFLSLLFLQMKRKLSARSIQTPNGLNGYNLANCPYG